VEETFDFFMLLGFHDKLLTFTFILEKDFSIVGFLKPAIFFLLWFSDSDMQYFTDVFVLDDV
jgi:hypothetical protein